MTLVNRLIVPLAILISLLPAVLANDKNCKSNHFWYDKKNTCLPTTPPHGQSNPPHGKSCPSKWYWDNNRTCCLPTSPPHSGNSSPTCQHGHSWNENDHSCSTPETKHNPGSGHPGSNDYYRPGNDRPSESYNHGEGNPEYHNNHGNDNSEYHNNHGYDNSGYPHEHGSDKSGYPYDHGYDNSGHSYNHENGNPGHSYDHGNNYPGCEDESQFWYYHVNSCIPHGGYNDPPHPPTGSRCPQFGWYWADDFGCCLPSTPSYPSPQCPSGWAWNNDTHSCQPVVAPPQPSHRYGNGHRKKRSQQNLYPFY